MPTKEKIKSVRGLRVFQNNHPAIRQLLDHDSSPEIHGDKIWFSSYLIMDYLDVSPLPRRPRVMEIGCGWGLLSVYCAKKFRASVTAVDADPHVFPFVKLHARENGVQVRTRTCRYEKIPPAMFRGLDLVAGGDICFWEELVDPLYKCIKRAVDEGVGTIIIADPGRPPFLKLAKRCKQQFGGLLMPYTILKPMQKDGYLLTIYN